MTHRRRAVLKACLGAGLGIAVMPILDARQDDAATARPREGDLLVKTGDATKTPLTADDVPPGSARMLAWTMDPTDRTVRSGSRFNQVILMRFDASALAADTRARAAGGIVAYSIICTHGGCDVDDWLEADQWLSCSCHFSAFDPKDGAKVMDGPAPRPLPALPLKLVDGKLVVAKPFSARVGFEPV